MARKYVVQWAYADRETGENSEWHDWDSSGIPEHSPDALVTIPYGSGSVSDGKFPIYCCEPAGADQHIGKVLGYNSPNYEASAGSVNPQRVIIIPEWDLRAGNVQHLIVCGDVSQSQLENWSQHWGQLALDRFLAVFGANRPNPSVHPSYSVRAVYGVYHHTLTYQAVQLIGGALNWANTDNGDPPRHPLGTSVVGQIFGGTGVDLPPSFKPFQCTTVLGIHFGTNTSLSHYSYQPYAHYKMTGSVAFNQVGCNQEPCGDPTSQSGSMTACSNIPPSETGVIIGDERRRPGFSLGGVDVTSFFGYNTPPEDGDAYILGSDGAHLDNEIWRNYWIHRVSYEICVLNNTVKQGMTDMKTQLSKIESAIRGLTLNVNTTQLEQKLAELKAQFEAYNANFLDAFKLT